MSKKPLELTNRITFRTTEEVVEFLDQVSDSLRVTRNGGMNVILSQCAMLYNENEPINIRKVGDMFCVPSILDEKTYNMVKSFAEHNKISFNSAANWMITKYLEEHPDYSYTGVPLSKYRR